MLKATFVRTAGERDRIFVTRSDGSEVSWSFPSYGEGLPHDLVHWVVESCCGLRWGFWGRVDAGADPDAVARAAGVAPFFKERAVRQVRAWSPAELRAGLAALSAADRGLKEGLTEPGLALELLVLDLLGGKARWG